MLIYATTAELTAWLGTAAPANATTLLRSASILVHRATMTAIYDVNVATSLPVDAALVAAFSDATCSQVGTWIALALDPAKGAAGAAKVVSAKSIGSGSITYAVTAAAAAMANAATDLSQEAWLILAQAGLASGSPWELG